MFENLMIYDDIQITIGKETKDIKSWLTKLNKLVPSSISSISPTKEEYNTAMHNIAILLRCANLSIGGGKTWRLRKKQRKQKKTQKRHKKRTKRNIKKHNKRTSKR